MTGFKSTAVDVWAAATLADKGFLIWFLAFAAFNAVTGEWTWAFVNLLFFAWDVSVLLWKAAALKWQRLYEAEKARTTTNIYNFQGMSDAAAAVRRYADQAKANKTL